MCFLTCKRTHTPTSKTKIGKDISQFSLYPNEQELLLFQNASLVLEQIATNEMKALSGLAPGLDMLHFRQAPTAPHLKNIV